jgi:hypothetical protein
MIQTTSVWHPYSGIEGTLSIERAINIGPLFVTIDDDEPVRCWIPEKAMWHSTNAVMLYVDVRGTGYFTGKRVVQRKSIKKIVPA